MKFFRNRLKIIDNFIIGKYLGTFFYTLILFVVIIVIFDLSEKLDDFLSNNLSAWDAFRLYYVGSIPFYVNMLSPLINFISVIFFTAKMADQTEIVPILSGGVSFNRFLRPYLISASLIFLLTLGSNLFIIPHTNKIKNKFENEVVKKNSPFIKEKVHIKLDSNTYISIDAFDNRSNIGYRFTLDQFQGDILKKKIFAQTIKYDSTTTKWLLTDYSIRTIDGLKEKFRSEPVIPKDTTLDMRPNDFSAYDNVFSSLINKELEEKIEKERVRGTGVINDLLFERYKRWIHPLSAYVLTLIGVALSSRKVRGGVGLPLGIGIFISFVYIVLNHFAFIFSIKGGFSPFMAAIVPSIIFGLLGLFLLKRAPK